MRLYDEHGRQYMRYSIDDLLSVELLDVRFSSGSQYFKDATDGLWYKVILVNDNGVRSLVLADTGVALPVC